MTDLEELRNRQINEILDEDNFFKRIIINRNNTHIKNYKENITQFPVIDEKMVEVNQSNIKKINSILTESLHILNLFLYSSTIQNNLVSDINKGKYTDKLFDKLNTSELLNIWNELIKEYMSPKITQNMRDIYVNKFQNLLPLLKPLKDRLQELTKIMFNHLITISEDVAFYDFKGYEVMTLIPLIIPFISYLSIVSYIYDVIFKNNYNILSNQDLAYSIYNTLNYLYEVGGSNVENKNLIIKQIISHFNELDLPEFQPFFNKKLFDDYYKELKSMEGGDSDSYNSDLDRGFDDDMPPLEEPEPEAEAESEAESEAEAEAEPEPEPETEAEPEPEAKEPEADILVEPELVPVSLSNYEKEKQILYDNFLGKKIIRQFHTMLRHNQNFWNSEELRLYQNLIHNKSDMVNKIKFSGPIRSDLKLNGFMKKEYELYLYNNLKDAEENNKRNGIKISQGKTLQEILDGINNYLEKNNKETSFLATKYYNLIDPDTYNPILEYGGAEVNKFNKKGNIIIQQPLKQKLIKNEELKEDEDKINSSFSKLEENPDIPKNFAYFSVLKPDEPEMEEYKNAHRTLLKSLKGKGKRKEKQQKIYYRTKEPVLNFNDEDNEMYPY